MWVLRCENVTHLHIHVCTLYAINSFKYMYIVFIHKLETDMKSLLFVNVICKYSHFLHLGLYNMLNVYKIVFILSHDIPSFKRLWINNNKRSINIKWSRARWTLSFTNRFTVWFRYLRVKKYIKCKLN